MFLDFVEGPLWYAAVAVFLVGVAWRLAAIARAGLKDDLSVPRNSGAPGAVATVFRRFLPHREFMRPAAFQMVAGYAFHIGLFVLVLFAAPHVKFIEQRILGFGWTPAPHWVFLLAANFAFAGLLLLWLRRMLDPVLRRISTLDDHIGTGLTFVVMFTGCMALFESHDFLRALHMLFVDLLLIYFPFSRLMHAFTFIFSRGFTGANMARKGVSA